MADSALSTNPAGAPVLSQLTDPAGLDRLYASDMSVASGSGRSKYLELDTLFASRAPVSDVSVLATSSYAVSGSGTTPAISVIGTWSTTGIVTGWYLGITDTASNAASRMLVLEKAGDNTNGGNVSLRKARGTIAAPTILTSGDPIFTINFSGYTGTTGYVIGASIRAVSSGTVGPTGTARMPASLIFATATNAAPSVLTDALTIDSSQTATFASQILAGTTGLYINGTGTAPAGIARSGGELYFTTSSSGLETGSTLVMEGTINIRIRAGMYYGWSAGTTTAANGADVALYRDAAATLALRNGTVAPQVFRVYETESSSLANYGRIALITQSGSNYLIRSQAAGTALSSGKPQILQVGSGTSVGTDIAGQDHVVHGGISTGTGVRGAILFQQSAPGSTSSTANSLSTTWSISSAMALTAIAGANIAFATTTGSIIGVTTSQLFAFWGKSPIAQPTTGISAAAFVANTSGTVNDTATFGGYTLGQIAAALINVGLLA